MRFPIRSLTISMLLCAIALAAGCGGNPRYARQYQDHIREYSQSHAFETHTIERDGAHIAVREFRGPAAPDEPTIIMMHGYPDSQRLYDRIAPLLAEDLRVITFDFIGWGDSDKPDDFTYDFAGHLRDLEAVIAHFDVQQAIPVSHASSGPTAINWALEHPDNVTALVILNSFYQEMESLRLPEAIERFSTPGLRRTVLVTSTRMSDRGWQIGFRLQLSRFFPRDDDVRERYLAIFVHQALGIRPAFLALNEDTWASIRANNVNVERLQAFPKPVRIVFGENDAYLNPGMAREFGELFPDAIVTLMPDVGHYPQLEEPERVAAEIIAASGARPFREGETENGFR